MTWNDTKHSTKPSKVQPPDHRTRRKILWRRITPLILILAVVGGILVQPQMGADAQAVLTITPLTWNTVGLDATTPTTGPNIYPVGARVCNDGTTNASGLVVSFSWVEPANVLISLLGSSTQTASSLAAGTCRDFYFYVAVTSNSSALRTDRRYIISAEASGVSSVSTDGPRLIYVEPLAARDTLTTTAPVGPQNVTVGQTYQYTVESSTSGEAYQQLEHFLSLSNNGLRLVSSQANYSIPTGAVNQDVYADACGWEEDPASVNYRTCVGPVEYQGGTVGGTVVTTYTLEVLAEGTFTLTHTLYGLSGESFYYNSDFGDDTLVITATNPVVPPGDGSTGYLPIIVKGVVQAEVTPSPTGSQTAAPTPTFTGTIVPNPRATKLVSAASARIGQSVTFTFQVNNTGTAPAEDVVLTDNLSAYTYISISNLETTRGTVNINARTAIVNIGTIYPGEVIVVTLVVTVNSTATTATNVCNTASITFTGGTARSSNQMCFQAVGGPVLPGTGELPIETEPSGPNWQILIMSFVIGILGALALTYALQARARQVTKANLYLGGSVLLIASALLAAVVGLGLVGQPGVEVDIISEIDISSTEAHQVSADPTSTVNPLALSPSYLFATPELVETLPSYPIPSPTVKVTPKPGDSGPDTSPVVRVSIPKIDVDARAAYVPFDGHTWLIQGLREEVAWMGDTSWPGLGGNTGLAGHVTVRGLRGGGPFRYLVDLVQGDTVVVYTERNAYTYEVRSKTEVDQMELSVIQETENSQITMVTCIDWNDQLETYLKRLIVVADLVKVEPLAYYQGN